MDDDKSMIGGGGVVIAEKCNDDWHYREWNASDNGVGRQREREAKKDKAALAHQEMSQTAAKTRGCKTQDDSDDDGGDVRDGE